MIGGCSFEARNQRCFYINFTRLHLSFQLCVASANLSAKPPPVLLCCIGEVCWSGNWSFKQEHWLLGDDLVHFHILHFICFNLVGYDLY